MALENALILTFCLFLETLDYSQNVTCCRSEFWRSIKGTGTIKFWCLSN